MPKKKSFVPCYRVTFNFFDYDDHVFRTSFFEVDYFLKDEHGVLMFDRVADNWCIPYYKTTINFERLNKHA